MPGTDEKSEGPPSASVLAWLCAGLMLVAIAAGPAFGEYGAFRYTHLVLAVLTVAWCLRDPQRLAAPLRPSAWAALLVASLLWAEASALSHYAAFSIDEADFGIFDWMLESAVRGRPGYSPIHDINHLGVHSSFLLMALVPLHALVPSPLWLVVLGPLAVWLGLFPLRRLVRDAVGEHGGLLLIASLAYVANAYTGRMINSAFRIEALLPALTLWFLVGWVEKRRWVWALAATALFLTKEDSTLFLAGFALLTTLQEPGRRREAVGLIVACATWLIFYSRIQPLLAGAAPGYGSFWSEFGVTPGQALLGMLQRPGAVLARVATSGVWGFYAPLLFLPWLSARTAGGLAPTTLLLGAATYATMHDFRNYYPIPLVAFSLFGVLEVLKRRPHPVWRAAAALALLLFPLFNFGFVKVLPFSVVQLQEVARVQALVADAPRVCAQMGLFPYLGYPRELVPMVDATCADDPNTTLVFGRLHSPPFEDVAASAAEWNKTRERTEVGPLTVFGPVKR